MSQVLRAFALSLLLASPALADAPKPTPTDGKPIDLVLCLDVSGSMNGLIDSAKIKLWDIVNEMARLKPTPNLRVALYSYGHSNYDSSKGWVKKDLDLTADLDDVYKALNALNINGGEEYVARVTRDALAEQKWSADPGALKLVFVCGNEGVSQDRQVSLSNVAATAKKSGVIVNTIYCGTADGAEGRAWADFAKLCGGRAMNIDMNKAVQQIAVKTEFDEEILKLNEKLNGTYVAYGREGKDRKENQVKQDANAAKAPAAPGGAQSAALERSVSKASALYKNSNWDLVDRMKNDKEFDLKSLKDEDLSDELRKLKPEERAAFVKKKADERAELQKKIADLATKRQKKVDEELAKKPRSESEKALDEAVKGVVREQAEAKGFEVKK